MSEELTPEELELLAAAEQAEVKAAAAEVPDEPAQPQPVPASPEPVKPRRARKATEEPAAAEAAAPSRNPETPAQHETDGWDDVPVQKRG